MPRKYRGFFVTYWFTMAPSLNNPRVVRAWYMYDWANSVYSLVISSAIFPIYYKAVSTVNGNDRVEFLGFTIQNAVLYSYALSLSFLIVAAMLPLLSGVADYTGKKKTFMKFFVSLGSLSCIGLYFFDDASLLWWGILCSMLASIGYSASLVFYDAFLPEIVSEDRYDATSARGYSMGYYGSVLLMVACLAIIMNASAVGFPGSANEAELLASRFSFLLVGIWWIGFSLIPFRILPENIYRKTPVGKVWTNGYHEIVKVWQSLRQQADLKRYLIAFFFYNSGVQTVMYLAALFGTDVLKLESAKLIFTILLIQLVASLGAWLFARLSLIKGNRYALLLMNLIWIGICIAAYFITTEFEFYGLAFVVGVIMGGIQSLSRATYAKLIPEDTIDHTSYFSFYDVTYNLSIVMGTFSFGFINQLTGTMRNSALFLTLYFIAGAIILRSVTSKDILNIVRRASGVSDG
jgi:MFS transporter, UMF1 family